MEETNFLQNLYSILVLIFTTPFYLELFIFFALSLIMMIVFMIKKNKKVRHVLFLIYAILIILLFGYYGKFLLYLFDKLVDLIFNLIYFPNVAIYFLMFVVLNINTVLSLFDKYSKLKFLSSRSNLFINVVNVFCFCCTYLFFFMILDVVVKNNLDFFSQMSIYSNQTFRILIQASTIMFVLNFIIVSLILIYRKIVSLPINNKMNKKNNIKDINEEEQINKSYNEFETHISKENIDNLNHDSNI